MPPRLGSHELAQRIREGREKRLEEQRRLAALQQAYREALEERQRARQAKGPAAYLPILLLSLLFVSFPLSDPVVDWVQVGVFALANAAYALVVSDPSHTLNLLIIVLINILLVRASPHIHDLPAFVQSFETRSVVLYAGINVVLTTALYFGYVRRAVTIGTSTTEGSPTSRLSQSSLARGRKVGNGELSDEEEGENEEAGGGTGVLHDFAVQREREWRTDVAVTVLLLVNVVVLVYTGVVPQSALAQSLQNLLYALS